MMKEYYKVLLTAAVVLVAAGVVAIRYWDYFANPWTRDGQVRAQVIQITPRVSAPIVNLPIVDNQLVKTGDLLFEIDPRTFEATLEQAQAELDNTRDTIEALKNEVKAAEGAVAQYKSLIEQTKSTIEAYTANLEDAKVTFERVRRLAEKGAASQQRADDTRANYQIALAQLNRSQEQQIEAEAQFIQAEARLAKARAELGAPGEANAQLRAAKAAVRSAELDLEFTRVTAPVDGYVTNLDLRLGDQAVANQAALALVDINSFWVHGFFRETLIGGMQPGDKVVITLMTYPDQPLQGEVESLGWGISQQDGSTGYDLLPDISPTFEWIRLAQRVPVRVALTEVPEGVNLRVGTTASVLVMTGTAGTDADGTAPPLPEALQ